MNAESTVVRKRLGVGQYLLAAVALLVLAGFEYWIVTRPFAEERLSDLNSLQAKKLDTFLEMNRLLTTLATAAIGAMGALIAQRYKNRSVPRVQVKRAAVGAVLAALSIYFGYMSYESVVWMLENNFLGTSTPAADWPRRAQFWLFASSVMMFADLSYHDLRGET